MTVLRIKILLVCAFVALMANAPVAVGDWNPGDACKMHFPQLPDPNGWDVDFGVDYGLADD